MRQIFTVTLAAAVAATPAFAQRDFSAVKIETSEVAPGIFMLTGSGGNIGLSVGADGAFLIDDQFAPLSDKIAAAVADKSETPVRFLVNTHYHGDHTGGNEAFAAGGALIVAHDNVRARLHAEIEGKGERGPAALPVVTFSDTATFHWNGEEIHVAHPAPAHTDGDAIVHFRTANVIHTGDLFFNVGYPYIDIDGGGDLDGYIAAQEQILSLADENTKIIPGHGELADKADLENVTATLKDIRTRIKALVDKGYDEERVVKAKPLADLDEDWAWQFIDGERMTRAAYKSLAKDAPPANP